MRLVKVFFSIIFLLLLICGLAIAALVYCLDPNELKPVLAQQVLRQTGYQLLIGGNLHWSLYPRIGIKADDVMLTMPNEAKPFLNLRDVRVATELLPLLKGDEKLEGDISIANIRLVNLNAQHVQAVLRWQQNVLTIENINAALYDGTLTGSAHGKELAAIPKWDWDVQFANIQLKPLLEDVNGADNKLKISGLAQIKLNASTQGNTRAEIINHLNGTSNFVISNGAVEGININYFIETAAALLNKQPVPTDDNSNTTAFNSFTGSATITNGVVATNDLLLTAPAFVTKAQGNIALLTQALNFQLQVQPLLETKISISIPVVISGDVHNPEVKLDTSDIEKFISKQDLQQVKSKAIEKIKEHVHGKAGQLLQQFLGN